MQCETIHAIPSWRQGPARYDCIYVSMDDTKNGMLGMVKQPNKPVYCALGNPTRGKVTESKVTVEVDLAAWSIGN